MQAVNLLPAYARPESRWSSVGKELAPGRVIKLGGAVAAACAIAVGGLYFYERSVVNDRRASLADTEARLAAVEATAAPLRAAEAASSARATVIRTVSNSRIAWEGVLRDLSRVLPDQVFLQNLQAQSPTTVASLSGAASAGVAATPAASTSFTISGSAGSQLRVALVLDRLALLPWLSNVTLQSSTRGAGSAADQFAIGATFSSPVPAGGAR